MADIATFIAEHYASPLRMVDLARHCHVSVRTLQNLCHTHCGEAPLRALRRFRLQQLHAAVLARPWSPLCHLYAGCGLTGSPVDRELFREMYGFSIRENQEACRRKAVLMPVGDAAEGLGSVQASLRDYLALSA